MKIGIIGSGNIGGTLGKRWAQAGHDVFFSSRHPNSDAMHTLANEAGPRARTGTPQEAIAFGEVVLLALPADAADQLLPTIKNFEGKVLLNAMNRRDGKSAGAEVRRLVNNAQVVRVFNLQPWEVFADPLFEGVAASILITGDSETAKNVAASLCRDLNMDPIDVGPASEEQNIESAMFALWRVLGSRFGRAHSIRVLRREGGER